MATSIPVDDTVSSSPSTSSSVSETTKRPIAATLIAMLIGAAIASLGWGGLLYSFAHSGRLSMREGPAMKAKPPVETATRLIALEPLLVNLADEGGSSYLRLSLTLQLASAAAKKDSSSNSGAGADDAVATIRDTALTILGRQTAEGLLAQGGKELLRVQLKNALARRDPDLKVKQIFFTDFLVQR
jgi:flagellar protein FliL